MGYTVTASVFSEDKGRVVLTTALKILNNWKATTEQACKILRISRRTIARVQQGNPVNMDIEQFERASIVLNCHAALRLMFNNPENVYGFVGMTNHNDFFNGRKPLEIMAQGDVLSLFETYKQR